MKIENRTKWNTSDLRKLVRTVVKEIGPDEYSSPKSLEIKHSNNPYRHEDSVTGCAWRFSREIIIRVPNTDRAKEFPVMIFCQVLIHELQHLMGLNHREMGSYKEFDVSFASGYRVRPEGAEPQTTTILFEETQTFEAK